MSTASAAEVACTKGAALKDPNSNFTFVARYECTTTKSTDIWTPPNEADAVPFGVQKAGSNTFLCWSNDKTFDRAKNGGYYWLLSGPETLDANSKHVPKTQLDTVAFNDEHGWGWVSGEVLGLSVNEKPKANKIGECGDKTTVTEKGPAPSSTTSTADEDAAAKALNVQRCSQGNIPVKVVNKTDRNGFVHPVRYTCDFAVDNTPLYENADGALQIGTFRPGTTMRSWSVCYADDEDGDITYLNTRASMDSAVTEPTAKAKFDTLGGWGWIPATAVKQFLPSATGSKKGTVYGVVKCNNDAPVSKSGPAADTVGAGVGQPPADPAVADCVAGAGVTQVNVDHPLPGVVFDKTFTCDMKTAPTVLYEKTDPATQMGTVTPLAGSVGSAWMVCVKDATVGGKTVTFVGTQGDSVTGPSSARFTPLRGWGYIKAADLKQFKSAADTTNPDKGTVGGITTTCA